MAGKLGKVKTNKERGDIWKAHGNETLELLFLLISCPYRSPGQYFSQNFFFEIPGQ
jgi:hypothetical protein